MNLYVQLDCTQAFCSKLKLQSLAVVSRVARAARFRVNWLVDRLLVLFITQEEGPRPAREGTRGAGVLTKTSTPGAGRRSKEPTPTPDFMKEFKKKKRAVNS